MIKCFIFIMAMQGLGGDLRELHSVEIDLLCNRFKQLLVEIRETKKTPDEARSEFKSIVGGLKNVFLKPAIYDSAAVSLVFPMRLLDHKRIGGRNGDGFRAKDFDLFDHNKKGSHPAHDIFLSDKNFDSVDDYLKIPIELLAATDGLVIAVEQNWQPESEYRGGNYVWIYDYINHGLWYYAHASEINVQPGDFVLAGNKLGLTGRTGFNAAKKRSQTHLHLTFLKIEESGMPRPIDTYKWLRQAKTLKNATTQPMRVTPVLRSYFAEIPFLTTKPIHTSLSEWPARPIILNR